MTVFDDCLAFILRPDIEGGYVNDPKDPGGETKYGIAKRSHPDLDIRNLTVERAGEIYQEEYWEPAHCDDLEKPVALCVFDAAVNTGISRSIKLLQLAAQAHKDGVWGPETLTKVRATPVLVLVNRFHQERKAFYKSSPNYSRYGRGWLRRNDACLALALSWIPAPTS